MPETAFIAVGSNIEPEANIPAALTLLRARETVSATSRFYRTAAIGRPGQPDFANGVWRVETDRAPAELKFDLLRTIEDELGRSRSRDKCAPRPIDLDVVLLGAQTIDQPGLKIPADDLARPFVLGPILELAPDWRLPDGAPLRTLCPSARPTDMLEWPFLTRRLREMLES